MGGEHKKHGDLGKELSEESNIKKKFSKKYFLVSNQILEKKFRNFFFTYQPNKGK